MNARGTLICSIHSHAYLHTRKSVDKQLWSIVIYLALRASLVTLDELNREAPSGLVTNLYMFRRGGAVLIRGRLTFRTTSTSRLRYRAWRVESPHLVGCGIARFVYSRECRCEPVYTYTHARTSGTCKLKSMPMLCMHGVRRTRHAVRNKK